MAIQAVSADGVTHEFPDGTDQAIIGKVMKDYALQHTKTQAPGYKFSDDAIKSALKQPGTSTVWMSPAKYLELTPDLESNPRTDRKGASLKKSLDKGDEVDEVPSLDVSVGRDGTAKVVDQDGRHRAQFAKDAGVDLIPVAVKRSGDKAVIKSLSGMKEGAETVPFDFASVTPPQKAPEPLPPPKKGLPRWDVLGDIGRSAETAAKARGEDLARAFPSVKEQAAQQQQNRRDYGLVGGAAMGVVDSAKRIGNALKAPLDELGIVGSLIIGTAHAIGGSTLASGLDYMRQPGVDPKAAADEIIDKAMIGLGPEGMEGGAAGIAAANASRQAATATGQTVNALRSVGKLSPEEIEHAAKVTRLRSEGIEPTVGQIKGGQFRRQEEATKSNPFAGGAVRAQEQEALDGFNRALYNRVLAPLGKSVAKTVKGGRDSLKSVAKTVSDAYEALKPQMRLDGNDHQFIGDLAQIRTDVGELPPAQQSQFEAILNNRVLHRLGKTGQMDGGTIKQVEEEVGTLARDYKSSGDAAQRGLGNALDDVTGAMRAAVERSSPPGVRQALTRANRAHAMLVRVEDAANARKASGGVVTPGDLLGAVRKMDKSSRKRAYAHGDALLQDFAEDAWDVLGNKMPDSGTPERLQFNKEGLAAWTLGKLSNPIASRVMNNLRERALDSPVYQFPPPSNGLTLLHNTPLPGVQNQLAKGIFRAAHVNGLRALTSAALMNPPPEAAQGQ